jgi:hypothetical protein
MIIAVRPVSCRDAKRAARLLAATLGAIAVLTSQ